ncbi:MAG: hypothetical protein RSE14_02145 [Erythrobacter sp.]|uniref:hypothetical protein n=1 Tax=Erythrobacter sp. TaxID=1042 RepID=UPI002B4A2856|nr:hypothetical protein [Erythrobacter sp.]WRH70919.1 MAG: hypothetical protein RSE14_02145 [Erythrobacter sp.]
MKSMFLRSGAVFAASLLAASALAAQKTPADEPETAAPAEQTAEKPETAEAPAEAEPERICRYIKLDTASRRKTKICRTTEEWRDLGNPR